MIYVKYVKIRVSKRGWGGPFLRHEKSGYRADTANLGRKAPQMEYIFRRCKTSFYAILLQIRAHGSSAWHRSTSPGVRPCGAAACNDMTTMAAASFAEVWFAGLSNTVAPPAFFFGIMCFHSLWRPILHWQRLVLRKLAAASCFAWDAATYTGLLLQLSVRPCAAAEAPRLDGLHSILLALARLRHV